VADGWYRVGPLPAGEAVLRVTAVSADSRRRQAETRVQLREGENFRHDIDLTGRGAIAGRLTGLRSGQHARIFAFLGAAEDVRIEPGSVYQAGLQAAARQFMREDGQFRLDGLDAGEYTVCALALTGEGRDDVAAAPMVLATVQLKDGDEAPVTLTFE
jgi:hypothetical protein